MFLVVQAFVDILDTIFAFTAVGTKIRFAGMTYVTFGASVFTVGTDITVGAQVAALGAYFRASRAHHLYTILAFVASGTIRDAVSAIRFAIFAQVSALVTLSAFQAIIVITFRTAFSAFGANLGAVFTTATRAHLHTIRTIITIEAIIVFACAIRT